MFNILIAGGSGFIGGHVLRHFETSGYNCISLGRAITPKISGKQITFTDFFNMSSSEFADFNLCFVIYAIGDPNLSGETIGELELLQTFLSFLKRAGFSGRLLLVSSNAANPDSGNTKLDYRNSLTNDYISRKRKLEKAVLSSNLDVVIIRAPAVIGKAMRNDSHVKRIILNTALGKLLSLPIFQGTIEIISVEELIKEIVTSLTLNISGSIIEPQAPAYSWSDLAKYITKSVPLILEPKKVLNTREQHLAKLLPISLRFLLFPHWVSKGIPDAGILELRHENILQTISEIKSLTSGKSNWKLVTGAASGLGAAITATLLNRGYRVIGIDINPFVQSGVGSTFTSNKFLYLQGDLSSVIFLNEVIEVIETHEVDGIFAVAGIGPRGPIRQTTLDQSRKVFEVNFFSTISLYGSLVHNQNSRSFFCFIGSSAGILALPNFGIYSATKSALESYFFSAMNEGEHGKPDILGMIPSGMKTNFQKANNVPVSFVDKFILTDPITIANWVVKWVEKKDRKSMMKYFGLSAHMFLAIRLLPFAVKLFFIKILSKGAR